MLTQRTSDDYYGFGLTTEAGVMMLFTVVTAVLFQLLTRELAAVASGIMSLGYVMVNRRISNPTFEYAPPISHGSDFFSIASRDEINAALDWFLLRTGYMVNTSQPPKVDYFIDRIAQRNGHRTLFRIQFGIPGDMMFYPEWLISGFDIHMTIIISPDGYKPGLYDDNSAAIRTMSYHDFLRCMRAVDPNSDCRNDPNRCRTALSKH